MDRSCSLLNSLRVVVTEKLEVLYGFVSACFGPTMTPQPLPSQLFLAQTSKKAQAMQRQGSFAERHFCSDMPSFQIKRCPADMETRVNIAATWGFATDGTKLIPSP